MEKLYQGNCVDYDGGQWIVLDDKDGQVHIYSGRLQMDKWVNREEVVKS